MKAFREYFLFRAHNIAYSACHNLAVSVKQKYSVIERNIDLVIYRLCKGAFVRSGYAIIRGVVIPVIFIYCVSEKFCRFGSPRFFFPEFSGIFINKVRIKHAAVNTYDPPLRLVCKTIESLKGFFIQKFTVF